MEKLPACDTVRPSISSFGQDDSKNSALSLEGSITRQMPFPPVDSSSNSPKVELGQRKRQQMGDASGLCMWLKSLYSDISLWEKYDCSLQQDRNNCKCDHFDFKQVLSQIESSSRVFLIDELCDVFHDKLKREVFTFLKLFNEVEVLKSTTICRFAVADFVYACSVMPAGDAYSRLASSYTTYIQMLKARERLCDQYFIKDYVPLLLVVELNKGVWVFSHYDKFLKCAGFGNLSRKLELLSLESAHDIDEKYFTGRIVKNLDDSIVEEAISRCIDILMFQGDTSFQRLCPQSFLYGEEFEYYAGFDDCDDAAFSSLLDAWRDRINQRLLQLGFPSSAFSINKLLDVLDVKIGSWQCRVFKDFWKGAALLEVNVSPYTINQRFLLNGRAWGCDEIFKCFITDIANDLNLKLSSGHKHVDLVESVGGNPELLFRMFVDAQNKAWLMQAFKTYEDSSDYCRFICQGGEKDKALILMKFIIAVFNKHINCSKKGKGGGFVDVNRPLIEFLSCLLYGGHPKRYVPVNYRTFTSNNTAARVGRVVQGPSSTAEFRFTPCSRSGGEAIKISRMLEAWFQKEAKDQVAGKLLDYEPVDPMTTYDTVELKEKFDQFIVELGLDPDEFRELLRT